MSQLENNTDALAQILAVISEKAAAIGIASITQTTTSDADGGSNVITVTLTSGAKSTFTVKNGSKGGTGDPGGKGDPGPAGANATINGVNALTLNAGQGISATQSGSTLTIATNYTYGTTDLTAGTSALDTGTLYFVYE